MKMACEYRRVCVFQCTMYAPTCITYLLKVLSNSSGPIRSFPPSRLTLLMTCPLCALSLMSVKTPTSKRTHLVRCAPQSGLAPEAALYAILHEEKRLLTRERARERKAEQERSMWDRLIATAPGAVNKPKKVRKATPALRGGPQAVELDRNVLKSARESMDVVHERLVELFGTCKEKREEEERIQSVNLPESQQVLALQGCSTPPLDVEQHSIAAATPTSSSSTKKRGRDFSRSKLAVRHRARHTRGLGLAPTHLEALFTAGAAFGSVVAARYARDV